jgi:hypothetical protein
VTSNTTSNLLTADPVSVKLGLPWYTSVPGAVFDFFVAFKSITFDWDKNGGVDAPPKFGVSTFVSINFVSQCIGLGYTFIQSFSGFVHILENAHRFNYMRVAGASAYVLLFANATKLWTKLVIQQPIALLAAWITAIFGMLNFVVLSLPKAGQKELYQLWSPWCTNVLTSVDSSEDGCSGWSAFDSIGSDNLENDFSWTCANSTSLVFFEGRVLPEVFNWAFAGLAGLLLLVTFYQHMHYWINRNSTIQYQQKLAGVLPIPLDYCPKLTRCNVQATPHTSSSSPSSGCQSGYSSNRLRSRSRILSTRESQFAQASLIIQPATSLGRK